MLFCWCQASLNRVLLIHWLNQQSLVCSQRSWKDTSFHFRYHVCWGSICVEPTGFEWIRIKQMRIASIRYMNRYVWNDARWCGWYEMPPSWEKCHSRKKPSVAHGANSKFNGVQSCKTENLCTNDTFSELVGNEEHWICLWLQIRTIDKNHDKYTTYVLWSVFVYKKTTRIYTISKIGAGCVFCMCVWKLKKFFSQGKKTLSRRNGCASVNRKIPAPVQI